MVSLRRQEEFRPPLPPSPFLARQPFSGPSRSRPPYRLDRSTPSGTAYHLAVCLCLLTRQGIMKNLYLERSAFQDFFFLSRL